jgi:hypothetical protein
MKKNTTTTIAVKILLTLPIITLSVNIFANIDATMTELEKLNEALESSEKAKTLEKDCVLRLSTNTALIPSDNGKCYVVLGEYIRGIGDFGIYKYMEQIEVNNTSYFLFAKN